MKQRVSKVLAVMMVAVLMITGKADAATIAQGQHTIEHLDNGDYIETVINDAGMKAALSLQSADKQITKTKTAYYKNKSGRFCGLYRSKLLFPTMARHQSVSVALQVLQLQPNHGRSNLCRPLRRAILLLRK